MMDNAVKLPIVQGGFVSSRNPYWLLDQAVDAFGRRDWVLVDGWLARVRLRFGSFPFSSTEIEVIEAEDFDKTRNPYWLLDQAVEANECSQPARAVGLLIRLNRLFDCPPFKTEAEAIEAIVCAGFGELTLVDTRLNPPGHHDAGSLLAS
jgi:hypothetical protein